MQTYLKFICCSNYDFTDPNTGNRVSGITCKCFEPTSGKIVKVVTDTVLENDFGDEILVECVPNGNHLTYQVA